MVTQGGREGQREGGVQSHPEEQCCRHAPSTLACVWSFVVSAPEPGTRRGLRASLQRSYWERRGQTPRPTTEPCWALAGQWPDLRVLGLWRERLGTGLSGEGLRSGATSAHGLLSTYQCLACSADTLRTQAGGAAQLPVPGVSHPGSSAPGPAQIRKVKGRALGIEPDSWLVTGQSQHYREGLPSGFPGGLGPPKSPSILRSQGLLDTTSPRLKNCG